VAVRHRNCRHLGRLRGRVSSARSRGDRIAPIYISNWFYGALIIVIAMLHIVNNLAMPATFEQVLLAVPGRARRDRAVVVRP
jgi:hypothetical protein